MGSVSWVTFSLFFSVCFFLGDFLWSMIRFPLLPFGLLNDTRFGHNQITSLPSYRTNSYFLKLGILPKRNVSTLEVIIFKHGKVTHKVLTKPKPHYFLDFTSLSKGGTHFNHRRSMTQMPLLDTHNNKCNLH